MPRFGKTGLHRSAGLILKDAEKVIQEVEKSEPLEYNPRLRDQAIGLQAAEASALKQLAKIRERKNQVSPSKGLSQAEGPMMTSPPMSTPMPSSPGQSSAQSAILVTEGESTPVKPPVVDLEQLAQTHGNKRRQGLSPEKQEFNQRNQTGS